MTIGENIKKARKKAGLKQSDLAEELGITQSAIAKFENDKTNIKFSTVRKFSDALEVPMSELIGDNWELFTDDEMQKDFDEQNRGKPIFSEEDWQLDIIVGKAMNLNEEGRYKIIEYENDLVYSGKYTKED